MHRKRGTFELHDKLFPLDDDYTFDFKDRVGVERLYDSVYFDEPVEWKPFGVELC